MDTQNPGSSEGIARCSLLYQCYQPAYEDLAGNQYLAAKSDGDECRRHAVL